jgi:DNA-binding response OmpR family regulator
VVLMSATFAEATERLRALAAGADDYVIEPVEPTGFLSQIKALLFARSFCQSTGPPRGGVKRCQADGCPERDGGKFQ